MLDLSRVFAGPWAAQMLADFGSDVIKVEHVQGGDGVRRMEVQDLHADGAGTGLTASLLAMNRGKKSLAVECRGRKDGRSCHGWRRGRMF